MDTVISAVLNDLISWSISFMIQKSKAHVANNDNKIPRLQRLLLRAGSIVEEAEVRQITNHGMLLQLKKLKEVMYRGYYVLDTFQVEAYCKVSQSKLGKDMDDLEATLDGMKEFLVILMHCPPVVRQPYNTYLFMEQCMFGRRTEKEHIINFLLHPCSAFDVLPVIGPSYVGKRTLVEHACREEIVQRSFSCILHFRSDDLNNLSSDATMENCKKLRHSNGKFLIVLELVHDTDMVAWDKLYHSLCHRTGGSKAILISGMNQVSGLGTVQALRLTRLNQEEYWYFFRVLAFGSTNPYDHHPDHASIAKEIATEIDGYFMIASVVTRVLRDNMNTQFWRRALWYIRKSNQMRILVFGEDPMDISKRRFCPYFYRFSDGDSLISCYNRYEIPGPIMQGDIAGAMMAEEVLNGRVMKHGEKFNIITQSPMPPYHYYITNCVVEKPQSVDPRNKCLKRKRNRQKSLE